MNIIETLQAIGPGELEPFEIRWPDPFIEQRQEYIRHAMFSEKDPEKIRALRTECGLLGHTAYQWNIGIARKICRFCGFEEK